MTKKMTIFAKRLKAQLDNKNITVLRLAEITGLTNPAIYRIASGDNDPKFRTCESIAKALGYTLAEFISDKPNSVHTLGDCLESIQQALHNRKRK